MSYQGSFHFHFGYNTRVVRNWDCLKYNKGMSFMELQLLQKNPDI